MKKAIVSLPDTRVIICNTQTCVNEHKESDRLAGVRKVQYAQTGVLPIFHPLGEIAPYSAYYSAHRSDQLSGGILTEKPL